MTRGGTSRRVHRTTPAVIRKGSASHSPSATEVRYANNALGYLQSGNLINLDTVKFPPVLHACKIALMIKTRPTNARGKVMNKLTFNDRSALFAQSA